MSSDDFEARLRAGELFHSLKVLPGAYMVLRVDGRSFSRLTEERYQKPFDASFHQHMVETARALLDELKGIVAYTESDEVSVLLARNSALFDREVEKLVSLSAGIASATFALASGLRAHFDARIWVGARDEDVRDYFRWREGDAARP